MNSGEVGRSILWFVVGVLIAGASFVLLRPNRVVDSVTIENYSVRPEIARETQSALRAALEASPMARVSLLANGRLLVTAPVSVQKGVQRILAEVGSKQPEATPSIRFEAWLIRATRGTTGETVNLAEVQPALDEISKTQGSSVHFELIEKLSTLARTGADQSEIHGSYASMELEATVRRSEKNEPIVAAELNIKVYQSPARTGTPPRSIETLAELRPGELLVVGQSGDLPTPSGEAPQIYYIVRASI